MRPIHTIIIHCSDSEWGDAKVIDQWHRARGFDCIGYHFVILNGFRTHAQLQAGQPVAADVGLIEAGRPLSRIGAHCKGHNTGSIGICLIGKRTFAPAQLDALRTLVASLELSRPVRRVAGHYELFPGKTCPNLDMDQLRDFLGRKA